MNNLFKKVLKKFQQKSELEKFFESIGWKEYNRGFSEGQNGKYTFFSDPDLKENKSYKLGIEDGFSLFRHKIFE